MTARQAIGCWCLAMLIFGLALAAGIALTSRQHVCDSVIVNHYAHNDHPVCVRYEYQPPTETP